MKHALARLVGLTVLLYSVELLERVAFRAGVDATRVEAGEQVERAVAAFVVEDLADDLVAADVSDVVDAHAECCPVPA